MSPISIKVCVYFWNLFCYLLANSVWISFAHDLPPPSGDFFFEDLQRKKKKNKNSGYNVLVAYIYDTSSSSCCMYFEIATILIRYGKMVGWRCYTCNERGRCHKYFNNIVYFDIFYVYFTDLKYLVLLLNNGWYFKRKDARNFVDIH